MEQTTRERLERVRNLVSEEAYERIERKLRRQPNYYQKNDLTDTERFSDPGALCFQLLRDRVKIPRHVDVDNCDVFLRSILEPDTDFDSCKRIFQSHLETRDKFYVERCIAKARFLDFVNLDVDITMACPHFVLLNIEQYESVLLAQKWKMISKISKDLYMRFFHRVSDSTPRNVTKDNYRQYLGYVLQRDFAEWKGIPFAEIAADFYQTLAERRGWN